MSEMPDWRSLVFVDIETTGLDFQRNNMWEVAAIGSDGSVFREAWIPEMTNISLEALRVNRFMDRYQAGELYNPEHQKAGALNTWQAVGDIGEAFVAFLKELPKPRIFAGASVHFDKKFIDAEFYRSDVSEYMSSRIMDIPNFASAIMGGFANPGLHKAALMVGLEIDQEQAHDGLYDAWLTRRVYEEALKVRGSRRGPEFGLPEEWVELTYEEALERNNRQFI